MNLTPKAMQIVQILLKQENSLTLQELADEMKVSKRTVQREMGEVTGYFKNTGVDLITKMGTGVWLEGDVNEKKRLLSELQKTDSYDAGNKEERRKRLILETLKEKELKKLYYYSTKFQVSEATISTDLDHVEAWFAQYGITFSRRSGNGIRIQGSEADYRRAIRAFIEENINTDFIKEIYENYEKENVPDFSDSLKYGNLRNIFHNDLLQEVVGCMMESEKELFPKLTETAFTGLIIHVTIAVNRILKGDIIEETPDWESNIASDTEYELAKKLAKGLSEHFQVEIPAVEVFYIYLHLKGAKHEKVQLDCQDKQEAGNTNMLRIVNKMIEVFDPKDAWLYKQDNEFIQGLLAHLQPTVIRLLYHMNIHNPVLDSVKEEYGDVYERCTEVAKVLEECLNEKVPEDEIGFLAIHFGAARVRLESQRERIRMVHVGVVCASGIGISRLMSSKLKQVFRDRIQISVYGKRDINPYIIAKTDFFVSSISMEQVEIPTVSVNPFLNKTDMDEIQKLVYKYERMPEKRSKQDSLSKQMENISIVTTLINSVIKYFDLYHVDAGVTFDELLQIIGKNLSPYQDREEIIIRDIKNRERISSQIFAEFGFALLHSRSQGVTRPTMAICLPEGRDCFTDEYFKKIKVAFVMMIPEDENMDMNSEILGYISNLIMEEEAFLHMVRQGETEQIREALSKYLKKFFNEYLESVR